MFENLTNQFTRAFKHIRGQARLSDKNINRTLRDIKKSLLAADVALSVIDGFLEQVREQAVGQKVKDHLNPGQALIRVVHDTLIETLGKETVPLMLDQKPPVVILLAGLQGAGKTTTAAKLASFISKQHHKKVMLTSVDIYRPAAIEQLETLANQENIDFFKPEIQNDAIKIAADAKIAAAKKVCDVLIVDSAGRLHIDEAMMTEIGHIHQVLSPQETLFVVDSMTGQDAAHTALAFHEQLPLTGVILTKTDGDARGGAALSVRLITKQPIKFIGTGEKIDGLQIFHPDRLASRILDMGDVLTLIEQIESKADQKQSEKLIKKLSKGKGFNLNDFLEQMQQMQSMGGISSMMAQLPGAGQVPKEQMQAGEHQIKRSIAIIQSMTSKERNLPTIINGSRKRRISQGSGTQLGEVNQLLKQFTRAQKMMKKLPKMQGMGNLMSGFKGKLPF